MYHFQHLYSFYTFFLFHVYTSYFWFTAKLESIKNIVIMIYQRFAMGHKLIPFADLILIYAEQKWPKLKATHHCDSDDYIEVFWRLIARKKLMETFFDAWERTNCIDIRYPVQISLASLIEKCNLQFYIM